MKEQKPMDGLASRRIALKVIRQVTEEGAYASLALDAALKNCGLSGADRRLVSRLVYDTLDHLIRIDWALAQVMAKPDTDIKLKNILRLGACQILLEDRIPDSAATNLCVQLCAELGMPGLKGVCNGILRNLIRRKNELLLPEAETDPVRNASIRYSVPEWLYLKLREDYGDEADRILSFRNLDDGWTLRPNLTRTDDAAFEQLLSKKVWKSERTDMPHAWKITGAMDIARDADYQAGNFSIQSVGSMIACLAVGVKRGQQILDCCAAPGGKTCYLAELMGGTGRVQAWDIHEHRVALIEAQARRLGLENIRPMVRDAAKSREDLERSMDAVLLDAPCSGLGFMAQKPDLKLRVTEESVQELTALQEKLLDTVCTYVKPGGVLVYSTCSILKDENERQAARFLERHPEFEETALPDSIPERYRSSRERGLQLLEHRDGVEGFYLIRMRRKDD
ncbi:MAG: 16S rRNA (cytosine(967)-C(5))-methyltransferase RsmB [Clostridia bacterium]|nr:16S rRNA (cytosine(967)-C(5))-methyltransferase RsmB [Clostridia bacterium]